jgi:hypothetical protein
MKMILQELWCRMYNAALVRRKGLVLSEWVPPEDGEIIRSPKRRVLNKRQMMENVQNYDGYVNAPSS